MKAKASGRRAALLLLMLLTLVLVMKPAVISAQAAGPCTTKTTSAYTVQVCLTQPAPDATLSGVAPVTATANLVSGKIRVTRIIFTIDGGYTLTSYTIPHTFNLPSSKWVDGQHALSVSALLSDASTTSTATETVNFGNGVHSVGGSPNPPTIAPGTSPAPGSPLVLAAVGDGASDEVSATDVSGRVASWSPNLFLYLGDVYEKGSYSEFFNWYDRTYGRLRAITNPVVGNHEYGLPKAAGYFTYWNNEPDYYSFDAGGWHFIALNSTSQLQAAGGWSAQLSWLQQDLSAHAGACTIAYWHHPLYSVGAEGPTGRVRDFWGPLASANATLILNGHDHDYQRWRPLDGAGNPSPTGVTQIVSGTGGHSRQSIVGTDSRVVSAVGDVFGASRLLLSQTSAQVEYYQVSGTTATLLDSGTVPCQGYGTVTGLVTDSVTGSPMAGAIVAYAGSTATTGASGSYTIARAALGSSSITVNATGFASATAPVNVKPATMTQANVALQRQGGNPNGTFTGAVTNTDTGQPIVGATVSSGGQTVTADASGNYSLTVPAGTYSLTANAAGYAPATANGSVAAGATTRQNFSLLPVAAGFSDGFESGSMAKWSTNVGVTVSAGATHSGIYGAEASSASGAPSYARARLPAVRSNLYYRTYFKALTVPSSSATIMGDRTSGAGSIARLYMDSQGRVALRNDVSGTSMVGPNVGAGAWHSLEMHLNVNGASSIIEVWLDGNGVAALTTTTANLGTAGVGMVQVGENQSGRNFDFAVDDVVVQEARIGG